ncbi:MAG: tol-pal system protein YbgF [Pelagibacteraceae bacterium]|nr:tol-pal system protein YbgF [Pelagibacteraceae bacterium]|tara:strand:+ start:19944 stop:20825 length:882 start_codon:yes stop_codon:yes gene_type:complete
MRIFIKYKLQTILFVFFAYITLGSIAKAENIENVLQSLERLEKNVIDLQKRVYSGDNNFEITADNNLDGNFAAFDMRIRDLENEIKYLNTYVEEYIIRIDELNEKLNDLLLQQSQNLINNNIEKNNLESQSETENQDQSLGTLSITNESSTEQSVELQEVKDKLLPDVSPEEQFQYAFDFLRAQQLDEAKIALKEFININNDHSLAGSANYWLGEIIFLEGSYKEAALVFAEGYQKYPDSVKVPEMLLRLGVSLSKINKENQACITLNELIAKYPESRLVPKAKIELSNLSCT